MLFLLCMIAVLNAIAFWIPKRMSHREISCLFASLYQEVVDYVLCFIFDLISS